jgi:hypothetical protein
MLSKDVVQVFLLGPEIFALARFAQSKQVAIKFQTRVCIGNSNRRVIDAKKEFIGFFLPPRVALTRRKINDPVAGRAPTRCRFPL